MSALPPSQMSAMRDIAADPAAPPADLQARWDAIHVQAARVAAIAAISGEKAGERCMVFAELIACGSDAQRAVAARGVEDIEALMRIGLTALSTVKDRGQDASVPALALWREFHHAREAVLATLFPCREAA